jgi:hypothetical protein
MNEHYQRFESRTRVTAKTIAKFLLAVTSACCPQPSILLSPILRRAAAASPYKHEFQCLLTHAPLVFYMLTFFLFFFISRYRKQLFGIVIAGHDRVLFNDVFSFLFSFSAEIINVCDLLTVGPTFVSHSYH